MWINTTFIELVYRRIDILVNQHKLIRRIIVTVILLLNVWIARQIFQDISEITGPAAAAYATAAGLLNLPLLYYFKQRDKEHD